MGEVDPRYFKYEARVAEKMAKAWDCEYGRMGPNNPLDVYFMKEGNLKALAEIRTRPEELKEKFKVVYIDIDKWFHMINAETALGIPAFYVMAYKNGIFYMRIGDLPARDFKKVITGRTDRAGFPNDVCPVILAPISYLKPVCDSSGVFDE